MHIALIGSGNIGSLYGSNLARIGEEVTMIDVWEDHVCAMRDDGLQMSGLNGTFTANVNASTGPEGVAPADLAIICVNTYDTPDAAETASRILKSDGYALTLQNGMGNLETLVNKLGEGRVMGGLTFHSGDLQSPGSVNHTNRGPTYLGELNRSKSGRLAHIQERMEEAGMQPSVEDDIITTIWSKFIHNCGINALCAITDLRPGHLSDVPDLDAFQTQIIQETLALAAASGIKLLDPDPVTTVKDYCRTKFHRVSMVQHLSRGRQTEIDALNGYVARRSGELGLSAPANDALARLIKGLQHVPQTEGTHVPE